MKRIPKFLQNKILKEVYKLSDSDKLKVFNNIIPQLTTVSQSDIEILLNFNDTDKIEYLNCHLNSGLSAVPVLANKYLDRANQLLMSYKVVSHKE